MALGGSIKGITIEFRGDTTKLDSALRKISTETRNIDKELKNVNRALKLDPKSVELWKQKQELLNAKLNETKEKITTLKDTLKKIDSGEIDATAEDTSKLKRELAEAEAEAKSLDKELKSVGNANLKALSEGFKEVGGKMMSAGKTLSTYVTAPLAAAGTVGIKKFAEVDKTMQLTNKTMGNTKEQAGLLNKAMKSAAANSTYGMNDAATATLNFARAGLKAEDAAEALAPAMNLAAGEGGDLDTVSAGLVATINTFGDSFDKAAEYTDVFANACNNSALDIDSLSSSMSTAAPIFSAAGYSVKDAALYMGTMANAGIDANKAATSLKTGLARLVSPAKSGAAWMDKLGIEVTNADGSMKDSVTIQKELHDAFMGLSESEQLAAASAIFGKNQMSPWLALIRTSPSDVNGLNTALGQTGTTTEMANAMMSGFGGSLEKLKSGIDVMATSFGEALAPTIQKVADGIQKLVDWFNKLSPRAQKTIATIALVVAAIGPLLIVMGAIATGIGSIISLVGTLGPVLSGLGGAISGLASGPLLIIVAAIAAVIAIGVLLYKNWDKIKAKAAELKQKITEAFDNIKEKISTTWDNIKTKASNTWEAIKNAIVTPVTNAIDTVKEAIKGFKTSLAESWKAIKEGVKAAWDKVKEFITEPIKKAKENIIDRVQSIREKVGDVFDSIKEDVNDVWQGIKEAITKPIDKAKETLQKIIDRIKNLFPVDISDFFSHIKLPHISWEWDEIGDTGIDIPKLKVDWWKQGGIFTKPTLLGGGNGVGEAGAEAVLPLRELWDEMDKRFSGGDEITVNVYASAGMDVNDLALKVEQRLVQLQKQRTKAYGGV